MFKMYISDMNTYVGVLVLVLVLYLIKVVESSRVTRLCRGRWFPLVVGL